MKRILTVLLASALATGMLAGCGGSPTPEPQSSSEPAPASSATPAPESSQAAPEGAAAPAADASMSAEISWWAFPTFATIDETSGKYEQSIVDAFNAKYPNIKVSVEMIDFTSGPEKIATAIQGGTAPDVLFDAPGRIIDYGKSNALADLNDMFTDELKTDIGNENILSSCSDGTNYYMYPLSSGPFTMAYNKTILEKEGLMDLVPTEGDRAFTTEQFTAVNEALKEKGYKNAIVFCSGQGGDQGTRAFISNLYSSSITDKGLTKYTINDANGIKAMQYVVDAVKNGTLENGSSYNGGEAIEQFAAGTVTSTLLWSPGNDLNYAETLKANGIEVLSLPLPSDDGKPDLEYLVNGFCVFNNGDENRIAAGKELVRFMCDDPEWGPKNVLATNVFPVRQSFGNLYGDDVDKAFYASLTKYYGTYYNTINGFASMRPSWFANVQAALAGDKTAEQAMNDFVTDANASIAE